ncbi:MAG TPA: hypothetical protein VEB23_11850, partial [Ramlibacter sp.]|nr:hypothetical protein [Ramlibacter sp.]
QALENFAADSVQSIIQAWQAELPNLPETIRRIVGPLDAESLSQEQAKAVVDRVQAIADSVQVFRLAMEALPFDHLADMSFDLVAALGDLAGGMDKFLAGLQTYYQEFFSEQEQRQQLARVISNQLRAAGADFTPEQILGSDRDKFREFTEFWGARAATGDEFAGKLYTSLISLAGAFAQLHPQTQDVEEAVDGAADAMREYIDALDAQAGALQDAIDRHLASAKRLQAFRMELYMGAPALLTPEARYHATKAEFNRLAGLAPGDPERVEKLEDAGRAFLEASQEYHASSVAYFVDLAAVRGAVEASETSSRTSAQIAQIQLSVLQQQLAALQQIATNTTGGQPAAQPPAGGGGGGGGGPSFGGGATVPASASWQSLLMGIDWSDDAAGTAQLAGYMAQFGKGIADVQSVYSWYSVGQLAEHMKSRGYAHLVPGYAEGGVHPGGWAMVGEKGPELAYLPPSRIFTASDTAAMAAGPFGGAGSQQLEHLNAMFARFVQAFATYAQGDLKQGARLLEAVSRRPASDIAPPARTREVHTT